jgi:hypothetical protein
MEVLEFITVNRTDVEEVAARLAQLLGSHP